MYLNRLNSEQKELFLDLCIHASTSDNNYSEVEKEFIKLYSNEMQLTDIRYKAKTIFEDAIAKLVDISSEPELRIIVFELTALVLSDSNYDEMESVFMDKVIRATNIDKTRHKEMIVELNELTNIYKKLNSIVIG